MGCSRRNPQGKMRRNQPDALARGHFHNSVDRINQLIRSVRVYRDPKPRRVFISQSRNGNTPLRIVFRQNLLMSQ